jgi:hypothetical protein
MFDDLHHRAQRARRRATAAGKTPEQAISDLLDKAADMSWNYRVLRHDTEFGDVYAIHTVYYDDGEPTACSVERVICGYYDDLRNIEGDLEKLQEALEKPVLNYDDFDHPNREE